MEIETPVQMKDQLKKEYDKTTTETKFCLEMQAKQFFSCINCDILGTGRIWMDYKSAGKAFPLQCFHSRKIISFPITNNVRIPFILKISFPKISESFAIKMYMIMNDSCIKTHEFIGNY